MTSPKQAAANKRNAESSTGPRTLKGKKEVSRNALKHGLTGQGALLPDQDPRDYVALYEDLHTEHQPVGRLETELVDYLAGTLWQLSQVRRIEAGILKSHLYKSLVDQLQAAADEHRPAIGPATARDQGREDLLRQIEELEAKRRMDIDLVAQAFLIDATGPDVLSKVQRYQVTLENSVSKTLKELRELQSRRVEPGS